MTIWRQNKSRASGAIGPDTFDVLSTDPFDFGDDVILNEAKRAGDIPGLAQVQRSFGRSMRNIMMYGLLAAGVGAAGFAVAKYRPWTYWSSQELVYAYFEVRAVDAAGRPVAGAVVKNAGKKVGTTDSFGEWRRYMRVPLGTTVPIAIAKGANGEMQYAVKNFAVPPTKPEKNEMELRASVQLIPASLEQKSAEATAAKVATEVKAAATEAVANNTVQRTTNSADTLVATSESVAIETAKVEKVEAAPKVTATPVAAAPSFVSSHESVWFEAMGSSSSPLARDVVPALMKRAKELGLRVDAKSDWKVRLTGLVDRPSVVGADGGGLIMISSFDKDQTGAREFLRNYQSDARLTARGILFVLAHQVTKNVAIVRRGDRWVAALPKGAPELWKLATGMTLAGDQGRVWLAGSERFEDESFSGVYLQTNKENPCGREVPTCELNLRSFADVPPVPTWTRLKVRTQTHLKDQVKLFVSGYEARPVSDNVFEYWGQDRAKVNVTLVQMGRVIHRAQIVNDAKSPAMIAMAAPAVSRR